MASLVVACTVVAGTPLRAQRISDPELFGKSHEAAQQALRQYGAWEDEEEARRVREIGYRIARESGFTEFPFTFYLIDMPVPNAFALPGGQIFVTRGMLALDLDDDMLAGLLGHEIAHVVLRHGVRLQHRATLLNVLSSAALIGVLIAAGNSGSRSRGDAPRYDPYGLDPRTRDSQSSGDLVQGTAAASLVVSELLLRSYSREFEDEADAAGQRWAAAAGYSPLGTPHLMATMRARLPESKEYGYWRTHPFFDQRVTAAEARADLLSVGDAPPTEEFRAATQRALMGWARSHGEQPEAVKLVEEAALGALPHGAMADRLRAQRLHKLRRDEKSKPLLARDLGRVVRAYREEVAEVESLTPESSLLPKLREEIAVMRRELEEIYPEARRVLAEGVYETDFLATFLSNFPDAPETARAALQLGEAYARLRRQNDAVEMFLRTIAAAPESPSAEAARRGLTALAPRLEQLAALQNLALEADDAQLRSVADDRLLHLADRYQSLENGADYLRRYPDGRIAGTVESRQAVLADKLLSEVILYQTVGDHAQAVERIQQILTYAPLSPAADRLRDSAVLES